MSGLVTQAGMFAGVKVELFAGLESDPPASTHIRTDFTGVVGGRFRALNDIRIHSLGRWCISGNTQTHGINLWDDSGTNLGSASIDASLSAGAYAYADITPVDISANDYFRVASNETQNGDGWNNYQTYTMNSNIEQKRGVYAGSHDTYPVSFGPFGTYVPVNFRFQVL